MRESVRVRDCCRLCGSQALKLVIDFNSVPLFDEIVTQDNRGEEFSYPMRVYVCMDCVAVQSLHDIDIHAYYESYNYVPSDSPFVMNYMDSLVEYCSITWGLGPGSRVLEVGASDGYLLEQFRASGASVVGFEPAANLCSIALQRGVTLIPQLFEANTISSIPTDLKPVDFFVLLHTFDHLHDPSVFIEAVHQVLHPDRGILLLEVHDFADVVAQFETSLFGHEHATYLHLGSIERFLDRHGFKIVDANFLPKRDVRGSSMLVAAAKEESSLNPVRDVSALKDPRLDSLSTYDEFGDAVGIAFNNLRQFVNDRLAEGQLLAGYGGWGRGVTSLAMAGLGPDHLKFVVDGNERLHGNFTPVSSIAIVGPESVRRADVDIIIVFNHAYMSEIRENLATFIDEGGVLISVIDLLSGGSGQSLAKI